MVNRCSVAVTFVAAAAASAQVATAPVTLDFLGVGAGRNVRISLDGGSTSHRVFAGQIRFDVVEAPGSLGLPVGGEIVSFCMQPEDWVSTPATAYDAQSMVDALNAAGRSDAFYLSPAFGALAGAAGSQAFASGASRDMAAAMQLAVWDALFDLPYPSELTALDLDTGHFRATEVSQGVRSAFDVLKSSADAGQSSWAPHMLGFVDVAGRWQDQFTALASGPVIPASGSAVLAIAGGLLLGARRHRAG